MKYLISLTLLMSVLTAKSQSVDFGVRVSQFYNTVQKVDIEDPYAEEHIAMSIRDINNDTVHTWFNKFTMDNHFEMPLFLRFNSRKRWYGEIGISTSTNQLQMWGGSNYTNHYFVNKYGTFNEFQAAAAADGFTADSADYAIYIDNLRNQAHSNLRTVEQFKLISYNFMAGMRFFPHKSIKLFTEIGFSMKYKFRKHQYNYLDYSKPILYDLSKADAAIDKYAEVSTYGNFRFGLEWYRFRVSAFVQTGATFIFDELNTNPDVYYVANETPFDVIRSYGMSLSANLYSMDIGRRVKRDEVSTDEIIVSNIKRKKDRWDLGVFFDLRLLNEVNSYYQDDQNRLSFLKMDSVLVKNNGNFQEGLALEMIRIGDVKRVNWGPRIGGFLNLHLTKRFSVGGRLGGSKMIVDFETLQLQATALIDSSGSTSYLIENGQPTLKSAAYRKEINIVDLNFQAAYRIIDKDLFYLNVSAGIGFSAMARIDYTKNAYPPSVNELSIYENLDGIYSGYDVNGNLMAHYGEMNVDLKESPDQVINKFHEPYTGPQLDAEDGNRIVYGFTSFGLEAGLNKFTIGTGINFTPSYMDEFLLFKNASAFVSVGYKIFRR